MSSLVMCMFQMPMFNETYLVIPFNYRTLTKCFIVVIDVHISIVANVAQKFCAPPDYGSKYKYRSAQVQKHISV